LSIRFTQIHVSETPNFLFFALTRHEGLALDWPSLLRATTLLQPQFLLPAGCSIVDLLDNLFISAEWFGLDAGLSQFLSPAAPPWLGLVTSDGDALR